MNFELIPNFLAALLLPFIWVLYPTIDLGVIYLLGVLEADLVFRTPCLGVLAGWYGISGDSCIDLSISLKLENSF